jgi:phosphoketolase
MTTLSTPAMKPDWRSGGGYAHLDADLCRKMDAYGRAAYYRSVGQIYLQDNPLLDTPLRREHIKPRLRPAARA